ncbi:MAG: RNA chaperone Hfq [Clostridia bacterium]
MKTQLVLQDIILNYVRREKIKIEITVSSGEVLHGVIHGFDEKTVILNVGATQQLLYKANIISIISPKIILTEKLNEKEI